MVPKGCSPSALFFEILLFLSFCFMLSFPRFIVPSPLAWVGMPVYPLSRYIISSGFARSIVPSCVLAVVIAISFMSLVPFCTLTCCLNPKCAFLPFFVHDPSLLLEVLASFPLGSSLCFCLPGSAMINVASWIQPFFTAMFFSSICLWNSAQRFSNVSSSASSSRNRHTVE